MLETFFVCNWLGLDHARAARQGLDDVAIDSMAVHALDVADRLRLGGQGLAGMAAVHEHAHDIREDVANLVAMDDHVDHAMRKEIFGALEALGQLFANGLLDDARPGETDEGVGLGDMDVTEHGVGCSHAAGRRVRQNHDVGQARLAQALHGDCRARHLHQRENAFLHASATGGCEQDEGGVLLDGEQHGCHDSLTGRHAE